MNSALNPSESSAKNCSDKMLSM